MTAQVTAQITMTAMLTDVLARCKKARVQSTKGPKLVFLTAPRPRKQFELKPASRKRFLSKLSCVSKPRSARKLAEARAEAKRSDNKSETNKN